MKTRGRLGRSAAAAVVAACAALALSLAASAGADDPVATTADAADRLVVGVVPQRSLQDGEPRRMAGAGIDSVRFMVSWASVERNRDVYDWTPVDRTVREFAAAGLTTFPFLYGSPDWAAQRDRFACGGGGCFTHAPASIETRHAFARFAGAAVRRYGPGGTFWDDHPELPERPIRAWQIWNEPNLERYFKPDPDTSDYADIVRRASAEIKAADPDADVVLGGLFGPKSTAKMDGARRFLKQLYREPGIAESFDGVAVHPYSPTARGVLDQIRAVKRVARGRDADVDLWITEIGWASHGRRDQNLVKSPRLQAEMLRRTFTRFARRADRWGLKGVFWFAWRDTARRNPVCAWCPGAGLVSRNGSPKRAFRELRRLTRVR